MSSFCAIAAIGWSEIISMPNPSLLCMTLTERMTATAPGEGGARSDCATPGCAMRSAEASDSTRSWDPMRGKDAIQKTGLHMEQYHWLVSERSGGESEFCPNFMNHEGHKVAQRLNPKGLPSWPFVVKSGHYRKVIGSLR